MSWWEVTASSRKLSQGARGGPQWSAICPKLGAKVCGSVPPDTAGRGQWAACSWKTDVLGVVIYRGGVGGRKKSETWASAKSLSISDTIVLAFSKMSSMKICFTKRDNGYINRWHWREREERRDGEGEKEKMDKTSLIVTNIYETLGLTKLCKVSELLNSL